MTGIPSKWKCQMEHAIINPQSFNEKLFKAHNKKNTLSQIMNWKQDILINSTFQLLKCLSG